LGNGIERVIDGDQFRVPPGGNVRDLIQIKRVRMIDAFDLTSALG
jgi:hypothetical protein